METTPKSTAAVARAPARNVAQLKDLLWRLEHERNRLVRQRRRHLLIMGIGISLLVHAALMYFLATQLRAYGGGRGDSAPSYEFAIIPEQELTELEKVQLEEMPAELSAELDDLDDSPSAELEPAVSAAQLQAIDAGALPTLGGAGEGTGAGTLVGGGAGTSFFGVSSRGMRFAFIVDRSGSMQGEKMTDATQELARSIESLPDFAYFYAVLFSSDIIMPSWQDEWIRAKKSSVDRLKRWLRSEKVYPSGGTLPMPAFYRVFALEERPDVIFFLTDGEIPEDTPELVAELNRKGGRVIVNTIAFGNPSSQDLLRQIAKQSGGVYRYVAVEGE